MHERSRFPIEILAYGACMRSTSEVPPYSICTRRGPSRGRAASALLAVVLGSVIAGCATVGPSPAAKPSKEPYLLLKLNERKVYVKDDEVVPPHEGFPVA